MRNIEMIPLREKVIKGLETCGTGDCVGSCPYYDPDLPNCGCEGRMHDDALSLLKEQKEREKAICKEICDFNSFREGR